MSNMLKILSNYLCTFLSLVSILCHSSPVLAKKSTPEAQAIASALQQSRLLRQKLEILVEKKAKKIQTQQKTSHSSNQQDLSLANKIIQGNLYTSHPVKTTINNYLEFSGDFKLYPLVYDENSSAKIYCLPEYVTDIRLLPGDKVKSIILSNNEFIVESCYEAAKNFYHLLIKPISSLAVSAKAIVNTNERIYALSLNTSSEEEYKGNLAFKLPSPIAMPTKSASSMLPSTAITKSGTFSMEVGNIEDLNFNYRITGRDFTWAPKYCFDDGAYTYISFSKSIKFEPIISTKTGQINEIVNYSIKDNFIVIPNTFEFLKLKLKDQVVSIRAERLI